MRNGKHRSARLFFPLMILLAGSACKPQPAAKEDSAAQSAVASGFAPGAAEAAIKTPYPTPSKPVTMTAGQPLNCAKGPHWILYDMVAMIQPGETVTLTARSTPDWPDYYYVRKSDGTECWASSIGGRIDGDPRGLPELEAPPLHEIYFQVENQTGLKICDVTVRQPPGKQWGPNLLPAGAGAPGLTFGFVLMSGFYDVQIADCFGGKLFEAENTPIGPLEQSRIVKVNALVTFAILNQSGKDVYWIQYSRHGEDSWQDITGMYDDALRDGKTMHFTVQAGLYDFRAHESYETNYKLIFSAEAVAISPARVTVTIS
ncbi:MAG: hypothetical protein JW929_05340 [Anaerolineales bacterium]|nr:hypothetical protein [Anaerolineales bacterium]